MKKSWTLFLLLLLMILANSPGIAGPMRSECAAWDSKLKRVVNKTNDPDTWSFKQKKTAQELLVVLKTYPAIPAIDDVKQGESLQHFFKRSPHPHSCVELEYYGAGHFFLQNEAVPAALKIVYLSDLSKKIPTTPNIGRSMIHAALTLSLFELASEKGVITPTAEAKNELKEIRKAQKQLSKKMMEIATSLSAEEKCRRKISECPAPDLALIYKQRQLEKNGVAALDQNLKHWLKSFNFK